MTTRPAVDVAVIMRKVPTSSHWQPWRWELSEVVPQEESFGAEPRLLYKGEDGERWLHPGFRAELFRDEAEGYYLNVTTPAPAWFVLWRMEDEPSVAAEPIPRPLIVTLSYNEAGRWLDAQETVENVPAPAHIVEWMAAFAEEHYEPEQKKKRKRPESFKTLSDRFGQPASVTTVKKYGGGGEGHG
ncbi:DUF3305 domain-containing protein [Ramlibacter sp.]|uniref:DUF3305 domain-containing protein n=1 Tax=Ramlibacter sp. TaxID=1917967 RepID=UPI002FC751B0